MSFWEERNQKFLQVPLWQQSPPKTWSQHRVGSLGATSAAATNLSEYLPGPEEVLSSSSFSHSYQLPVRTQPVILTESQVYSKNAEETREEISKKNIFKHKPNRIISTKM